MEEPAKIEHIGDPFPSQAACEAELPKKIQSNFQYMGKDEAGLYVRTEFPQGWVGMHRCLYLWS